MSHRYDELPPSPCDGCGYVLRCRATGSACRRFRSFVRGESAKKWRKVPAVPSVRIGRKMGYAA